MKTWSLKTETESEIVVYFSFFFLLYSSFCSFGPEYFDCSMHVCSLASGVRLWPESNRNISDLGPQEWPITGKILWDIVGEDKSNNL